ncbi:HAD family hydrolase [Williamwhitmania taraxaci]|uniref:Putative hydrolase of the HAD superfamily n=1 Tax=Williamwhitmania taraxaci TaxID=1640674 RepID=A0A1G6NLU7_9BACT|nr:HAD family hydrolase [Williamwhitmania taraxaci]SDC68942.1 putative hydrolase of the HAD superfamily [Williamwhitmania taraxaci]
MDKIKVIGFDADDTLWVNEPYYQELEQELCLLMADYLPAADVSKQLFRTEMGNMELYGYGAKAFILSVIETAIKVSNGIVPAAVIQEIVDLGKELIRRDIELLDGIDKILPQLQDKYRLIVATKGDLLDQERKLRKSGLLPFFHHIEIMSDKQEADYKKLLSRLDIAPEEFLMVGNSLKSDILPVVALGGQGVYVPFHTTWQHESVTETGKNYHQIEHISELLNILGQ